MNHKLLAFVIVIIIIVIVFLMFIFLPQNRNFFSVDIFPELNSIKKRLKDPVDLCEIENEICDLQQSSWREFPGCGDKLEFYPFFMLGKQTDGLNSCDYINRLIKFAGQTTSIKSAFLARLKFKSRTDELCGWRQLTNKTLRCILPIYTPMDDIDQCGVSCDGNTKKLDPGEWIIMDASKKHYFYNKRKRDSIMLCLDIERPDNMPHGNSSRKLKKDDLLKVLL